MIVEQRLDEVRSQPLTSTFRDDAEKRKIAIGVYHGERDHLLPAIRRQEEIDSLLTVLPFEVRARLFENLVRTANSLLDLLGLL